MVVAAELEVVVVAAAVTEQLAVGVKAVMVMEAVTTVEVSQRTDGGWRSGVASKITGAPSKQGAPTRGGCRQS